MAWRNQLQKLIRTTRLFQHGQKSWESTTAGVPKAKIVEEVHEPGNTVTTTNENRIRYTWPPSLHTDVSALQNVKRDDAKKLLHVTWQNGEEARFAYVWLRDNCPAPHTYQLTTMCKARKMLMSELNIDVCPLKVENRGDHLLIEWPQNKLATYDSKWLALRNLDNPKVRARRHQVLLEDEKIIWGQKEMHDHLKWYQFDQMMESDRVLHDALMELVRLGILLIDGAPKEVGQLKRLAKKLGFEYLTHYGEVFTVKSVPNPTNLAYTSNGLGAHTDLPFLQYAPQLQALHYIEQSKTIGGENQFVDGYYLAQKIQKEHPEAYKILCTVPLEYVDDGQDFIDFKLTYRRPVFRVDEHGEVAEVHFNNQMRSWYYDVPVESLHSVYEALKIFDDYARMPENMLELKMLPGQIALFHNTRILHARSAFEITPDSGTRHMEGCYFNWDFVKSKIRLLRDKLGIEPNQVSV